MEKIEFRMDHDVTEQKESVERDGGRGHTPTPTPTLRGKIEGDLEKYAM